MAKSLLTYRTDQQKESLLRLLLLCVCIYCCVLLERVAAC